MPKYLTYVVKISSDEENSDEENSDKKYDQENYSEEYLIF